MFESSVHASVSVRDLREPEWLADARYFEYSRAADPIRRGNVTEIPILTFPSSSWSAHRSQIVPFDASGELKCEGPATSPGLCANFMRVLPGESVDTHANVTSELFYVWRGRGTTRLDVGDFMWERGDFFCLPGGHARHQAQEDAVLYYVHDAPLLRYLGVRAETTRFRPTLYPHGRCQKELDRVRHAAHADEASRISVLLANRVNDQTLTVTHVLWAMYGVLPRGTVQPAHRHQSVALDLAVDCRPGCYTLMGSRIDADGNIVDGKRVQWASGAAFITPPGMWHSHHNESDADAYVIPIQDAGLQTYLRSLDIRFGKLDPSVH